MPGVACVGVDHAGGMQLGMQGASFKVAGSAVVLLGDAVQSHPPLPPHLGAPFMVEGASTFRLNGIPVCREGHKANCGHPTTGRPFFRIP